MRISAKNLGAMALPDFCPRCFWIKNQCKLPYQIFPGIFSSIDSYTKKVVHQFIDNFGRAPSWIPDCKDIKSYMKPLHWSKFCYTDPATGITLSGVTDDILVTDKGDIIPDYKTAKFTATHDKLLPMYQAQLNGYSIIHESLGNKVRATPLIYLEPQTDQVNDIECMEGFFMDFKAHVLSVERNHEMVFELLHLAKEILEGPVPDGVHTCPDCNKLDELAVEVYSNQVDTPV